MRVQDEPIRSTIEFVERSERIIEVYRCGILHTRSKHALRSQASKPPLKSNVISTEIVTRYTFVSMVGAPPRPVIGGRLHTRPLIGCDFVMYRLTIYVELTRDFEGVFEAWECAFCID